MNLYALLQKRLAAGRPVRVGLIGAGKFGSMFLSQVPTTPGLEVAAIADLSPDRARAACRAVGWTEDRIAATRITDDTMAMIANPDVEVIVEATGTPPPESPMHAAPSARASTSSWSMWKPTSSPDRCLRGRRSGRALSTRSPMATSRR